MSDPMEDKSLEKQHRCQICLNFGCDGFHEGYSRAIDRVDLTKSDKRLERGRVAEKDRVRKVVWIAFIQGLIFGFGLGLLIKAVV